MLGGDALPSPSGEWDYPSVYEAFLGLVPRTIQQARLRDIIGGLESADASRSPYPIECAERDDAIMPVLADIGQLIIRDTAIRGGRPRLAGTGVTVERVVSWYRLGLSPEEIAERIGHLDLAQVHAALAYFHANREEIDAALEAAEREADALEREHGSAPAAR